jgi:hypothetical protein
MSSKTQWTGRVVTDTIGDAGTIVLDDESTARVVLGDWLSDYYDGLDADDMAWIMDVASGTRITYMDNETLIGRYGLHVELDGEWSAERSARAVYDYLTSEGEPVTMSRTSVSLRAMSLALGDDRGESGEEALAGSWWRCGRDGEGWIMDESDVREAAEYLRAVAGEN